MLGCKGAGQQSQQTPKNFMLFDFLRKPFVAVDVAEIQLAAILQAKMQQ